MSRDSLIGFPLRCYSRFPQAAWRIAAVITVLLPAHFAIRAQAPGANAASPQFEVVSVKPSVAQQDQSKISNADPGRFVASNVPLRFLILYAYRLLDHQLVGAPSWTSEEAFDVTGTYPSGPRPSDGEVRLMVQNLLAERFSLSLRRDKREVPAYALVLAHKDKHLGPQIHPSNIDCAEWIAAKRPKVDAGGPSPVAPSGKRPACMMIATRRYLTGGTRTIAELAVVLQSMVSRPVIDRTGLTGAYDLDLKFAPTDLKANEDSASAPDADPSIFAALQDQLGLKLKTDKETVDGFVIEHVSRPTAN